MTTLVRAVGISLLLSFFFPYWVQAKPSDRIAQASNSNPICSSQLRPQIDQIVNRPQWARSRWGILVQTLASPGKGQTLYDREAERYFIPASTTKLLTSAVALQQLGAQAQFRTAVYQVSNTGTDRVLRIVGQGDPSLSDRGLKSLAEQLSRQGIRRIDRLLVDDRYFTGPTIHSTWEWEDIQFDYGAPINSLIVNENFVGFTLFPQAIGQPLRLEWDEPEQARLWRIENQSLTVPKSAEESLEISRESDPRGRSVLKVQGQLRVGGEPAALGIAVANPTQNFAQRLQRILATEQITIGQIELTPAPAKTPETELAFVQSPPLEKLLQQVNQSSNNLYTEALLKQLGRRQSPTATDSTIAGLAVVKATLTNLGVDPQTYQTVDGSGLSRHNLVSPMALIQTLQAMAQVPEFPVYRATLAVGGTSGTLVNRFRNTAVQGQLQGKTGSMTGIEALAGYLTPTDHPPIVFSILVNQSTQSADAMEQAIDEIVLLLQRLKPC